MSHENRAPAHHLRRVFVAAARIWGYGARRAQAVVESGSQRISVLALVHGEFILRSADLPEDPTAALAAFAALLEEVEDHCFDAALENLIGGVSTKMKAQMKSTLAAKRNKP